MLKNYLKIAFRNLLRQKEYTFINLSGLTIGLASCILIGLWVNYEQSYDSYHTQKDSIYRVTYESSAATPPPLANALSMDFPDLIDKTVRFWPIQSPSDLVYNDEIITEKDISFTDPTIFDVFTHPFILGNPNTALITPKSIVISKSLSDKFFNEEDPLGKTINMWGTDLEVTGVFEDVPLNSHHRFNALVPMSMLRTFMGTMLDNWEWNGFYTYALLPNNVSKENLAKSFPSFMEKYTGEKVSYLQLQHLEEIYFNPKDKEIASVTGNSRYVYILTVIAGFVLLIACINFTILATAKSTQRSKEVGLRKTLGAVRYQLTFQFLLEALILSIAALFLSLIIVELALPYFSNFTGKPLTDTLHFTIINSSVLFLIALLVGILAGSYPAFYLSGLTPSSSLKANPIASGTGVSLLRKGLVSTQFAISTFLIIAMITVFSQLNLLLNKDLGFNDEQVIITEAKNYQLFKDQVEQLPGVVQVAGTYNVPGQRFPFYPYRTENTHVDSLTTMRTLRVNPGFIETLGIELEMGRSFDETRSDDINNGFVINQAAANLLGWEDPLGKQLDWYDFSEDGTEFVVSKQGSIIGVVNDFNYASLHNPVEPLLILVSNEVNWTTIRIRPDQNKETLAQISTVWDQTGGGSPFWYYFLDQQLDSKYNSEKKLGDVFAGLTILALLIACFGLFALISFTVTQRTKEIGIRKVLGASVSNIVTMLSTDFIKLVVIGFLVAIPLAWFAMQQWLADFAYRVDIGVGVFVIAGASAIAIALLTVSWQAIKAATANPVDSLKSE